MLSFRGIVDAVRDKITTAYPGVAVTEGMAKRAVQRAYRRWATRHPWSCLKKYGEIPAVADYTTGYILSWANGGVAVVGDGTSWDASMVGAQITGSGDSRSYIIASVTDTTHLTVAVPYEGTTISADTTYTISRKIYRCPADYMGGLTYKDSAQHKYLKVMMREEFERRVWQNNLSSRPETVVDAGTTVAPLVNTGKVTVTRDATTAAFDTAGTLLSARDKNRMLWVEGFDWWTTLPTITDDQNAVLADKWPFATGTYYYMIDPPGIHQIELFPSFVDAKSLNIWYFRRPKPIAPDNSNALLDMTAEMQDVIVGCTLFELGLIQKAELELVFEDAAIQDGLMKAHVQQRERYGTSEESIPGQRLTDMSPPFIWSVDGW